MKFKLSKNAKKDLRSILSYTNEFWGEGQMLKYSETLDSAFEEIVADPYGVKTKDRSSIFSGIRSYKVGRHQIFFRQAKDKGVFILRILHEKMNFPQHLKKT